MLKYAKMLLAVAVLCIGFTAQAQPPAMLVTNNTACDMQISIVETDASCNSANGYVVTLPPFMTTTIPGSAPATQWAYCKIYNDPICLPLAPNQNIAYIGQACGPYPIKDYYVTTGACTACAVGIKAAFTSATSILIW